MRSTVRRSTSAVQLLVLIALIGFLGNANANVFNDPSAGEFTVDEGWFGEQHEDAGGQASSATTRQAGDPASVLVFPGRNQLGNYEFAQPGGSSLLELLSIVDGGATPTPPCCKDCWTRLRECRAPCLATFQECTRACATSISQLKNGQPDPLAQYLVQDCVSQCDLTVNACTGDCERQGIINANCYPPFCDDYTVACRPDPFKVDVARLPAVTVP
ncbi:unnamed protein product [Pedinophyceae sp. YPF-701]|nr:unnamed protein product [Pedinophyceae sp. YPF-701]